MEFEEIFKTLNNLTQDELLRILAKICLESGIGGEEFLEEIKFCWIKYLYNLGNTKSIDIALRSGFSIADVNQILYSDRFMSEVISVH